METEKHLPESLTEPHAANIEGEVQIDPERSVVSFDEPQRQKFTIPRLKHALLKVSAKVVTYIKKGFNAFCRFCRSRPLLVVAVASVPLLAVFVFITYMLFFPQTIDYAFADQKDCMTSPAILPNIFKTDSQGAFSLSHTPTVSLGHIALFSNQLCAIPIHDPQPLASYVGHEWISVGGIHIGKSIKVTTAHYPVVLSPEIATSAVPVVKPLTFNLNSPDATFNYALASNGQTSECSNQKTTLTCSLIPLKLQYSKSYKTSLVRLFHGQVTGTLLSQTLQTINPVIIAQTSIGQGATVYDKPQEITLTTNKTITQLGNVTLATKSSSGAMTNIPITSSYSGQTIHIMIASTLPRQTTFDLHVSSITASDDSSLQEPVDLTFSTSGGPKVTAVNIPSFGISSTQSVTISFDQTLNPTQIPSQYASLTVNGQKAEASMALHGQQLTITPTSPYPVCATVDVQLSTAAQSNYGISGNSNWNYSSRSHCYTTFSIGTSVQGRPITAYQFGHGPSMVLYIGAMEGNEQNSSELLDQWIPALDSDPSRIPSWRTIVVIPTINPDGFAADTRLNADGIDLNRNFPSNNWQTRVTEPLANTVWTNDGGPYPLSAPESQALASFYEAHRPRLTLTMHSHGGIVEANDAGDSIALGAQYAALADYKPIPTYEIGDFFDYTTTGAFEDWANNKLGLPVLEVELQSPTADEYTRNLPALWAMTQVSQ